MPASNSDSRKRLEAAWKAVDDANVERYGPGVSVRQSSAPDPIIIGLSGLAQSGKDSTGKVLVEHHGFTRLAFADALKDVLYDLNPDTLHTDSQSDQWGESLQHWVDTYGWEWTKANTNARVYLQNLGVAVREHVDPDAWCNAVMRQVKPGGKYVITDVRFPNEFDAIVNGGGEVWRIHRDGNKPPNLHISETALDDKAFDRFLSLPDFHDDLRELDLALRVLVDDALSVRA